MINSIWHMEGMKNYTLLDKETINRLWHVEATKNYTLLDKKMTNRLWHLKGMKNYTLLDKETINNIWHVEDMKKYTQLDEGEYLLAFKWYATMSVICQRCIKRQKKWLMVLDMWETQKYI